MDNVTREEEGLLSCLSGENRITAVICWRDHSAIRAYDYCMAGGIRVPDDVAIAGFDGLYQSGNACDLTTVTAHWDEVGRMAPVLINQMLTG